MKKNATPEAISLVRNTPGVTGFVGMGNDPTPLQPEEVARILKRMESESPRINVTGLHQPRKPKKPSGWRCFMIKARFHLGDLEVLAVPVLHDNFVYLVCRRGQAILIDAGEAKPVFKVLERERLQLTDMLITHTHHDHVGGCRAIQDRLGVLATSPGVAAVFARSPAWIRR